VELLARLLGKILQLAGIRKAEIVLVAQDDMVQNANAQDPAGARKPLRTLAIFATGSGISRRMVVQENQRRRAVAHRRGKDLPGMHDRCAQTPYRYQDLADELIFRIEVQGNEMFAVGSKKLCPVAQEEIAAIGKTLPRPKRIGTQLFPQAERCA